MNNKILFLFPLFLSLPAATQCMEKEIVFTPKTMQEIRNERNEIYKEILDKEIANQFKVKRHKNNKLSDFDYDFIEDYIFFQEDSIKLLESKFQYPLVKNLNLKGEYSCLSLAIIAIKRPKFVADYDKWGQMHNYHLMQNPKQAPFKEKKEVVQRFLKIKPEPTSKDTYFALHTKYEEFGPTIIKKILLLKDILLVSEIEVPQEAICDIPLLMFNAEESLL